MFDRNETRKSNFWDRMNSEHTHFSTKPGEKNTYAKEVILNNIHWNWDERQLYIFG